MKNLIATIQTHSRYLFNLSSTFISQIVSALSVLILTPILLQRLGTAEFGSYGIILNIVVFSAVFDLGLNIGLLKKLIHKQPSLQALISTLFFFFCALLIVAIPIFFILYNKGILKIEGSSIFFSIVTAVLIVQTILAAFFDVMIQSANKIFVGKAIRVIKLLIEFFAILLLSAYFKSPALLLASIVANFIYLIILFVYARKEVTFYFSIRSFSFLLLVDHIKYSWWYFLTSVAGMMVFNSQVILMNMLIGAEGVAKYLLITRFYDIIRIGLANFTIVLFPTLAAIQAEGDWDKIKSLFKRTMLRMSLFAFLVFLLIQFIGKPFFLQWSKYPDAEMAQLFSVFAIFIFFIVIDNVSATFISALKLNKLPTILAIFQGLFGLGLGYILLAKYGIIGMAVASLIALVSTNFVFNPYYLLFVMNRQIKLLKKG